MKSKLIFMQSGKADQIQYCLNRMQVYVHEEQYEQAARMKELLSDFQSKEFDLDEIADFTNYMKLVKLLFD